MMNELYFNHKAFLFYHKVHQKLHSIPKAVRNKLTKRSVNFVALLNTGYNSDPCENLCALVVKKT